MIMQMKRFIIKFFISLKAYLDGNTGDVILLLQGPIVNWKIHLLLYPKMDTIGLLRQD